MVWSHALATAVLSTLVARNLLPSWVAFYVYVPLLRALPLVNRRRLAAGLAAVASLGVGIPAFEGALKAVPWAFALGVTAYALVVATAGVLAVSAGLWSGRAKGTWLLPFSWSAMEFVSGQWWLLGNYASPLSVGYLQAGGPLMPLARLVGVSGVGLLLLLINSLVAGGLHCRSGPKLPLESRFKGLRLTALLVPVPLIMFPSLLAGTPAPATSSTTVRVGLVQPVFDSELVLAARHWSPASSRVVDALVTLSEGMAAGVDLVVWPEGVVPGNSLHALPGVRRRLRAELLAGSVAEVDGRFLNSVIAVEEDGTTGVFDKLSPVPIGEAWIDGGRYLSLGGWSGAATGILVCLDSLFPALARSTVNLGAQLLLVLSDDSFALGMATPWLHLQATSFRAVESGVPVLFASASGPSALIFPDGRIVVLLDEGSPGAVAVDVPVAPTNTTPYRRLGETAGPLAAAATSLVVLLPALARSLRPARIFESA